MKYPACLSLLLSSICLLLLFGCVKDKPVTPVTQNVAIPSTGNEGVFILNEGNFGSGNGTLTYYLPETNEVIENVYGGTNSPMPAGFQLGDVVESMAIYNGKGYLVVNNSGVVYVLDTHTLAVTAQIRNLLSPRYFLGINANKAYITDFKSQSVSIVELTGFTKTGSIPCPGWTEELLQVGPYVYVTNEYRKYLYRIDPLTDQVKDSLDIGYGSNDIVTDKDGMIWISTTGGSRNNIMPCLARIDPATFSVSQKLSFPDTTNSPYRLSVNPSGDSLYYLYKSAVFKTGIYATQLPATPYIPADNRNLYGLGIHPVSGDIYVSDAIDYVQNGNIYRYTASGQQITEFKAGIIPGDFGFK